MKEFGSKGEVRQRYKLVNAATVESFNAATVESFIGDRGRLLDMMKSLKGLKSGWLNGETMVM